MPLEVDDTYNTGSSTDTEDELPLASTSSQTPTIGPPQLANGQARPAAGAAVLQPLTINAPLLPPGPTNQRRAPKHARPVSSDSESDAAAVRAPKRLRQPSPRPPTATGNARLAARSECLKADPLLPYRVARAGGNLKCGIGGCTVQLLPQAVGAARKHIREHYLPQPEQDDENQVAEGSGKAKGKGKAKPKRPKVDRTTKYVCRVQGCKDNEKPRVLNEIVRHMENTHIDWVYRCPAKGCGKVFCRGDPLKKHMGEKAGQGTHMTGKSRPMLMHLGHALIGCVVLQRMSSNGGWRSGLPVLSRRKPMARAMTATQSRSLNIR